MTSEHYRKRIDETTAKLHTVNADVAGLLATNRWPFDEAAVLSKRAEARQLESALVDLRALHEAALQVDRVAAAREQASRYASLVAMSARVLDGIPAQGERIDRALEEIADALHRIDAAVAEGAGPVQRELFDTRFAADVASRADRLREVGLLIKQRLAAVLGESARVEDRELRLEGELARRVERFTRSAEQGTALFGDIA